MQTQTRHVDAYREKVPSQSAGFLALVQFDGHEEMREPTARRGDGPPVHPGEGVVPIMKEIGVRQLKIVGTGFWITRYGLLATAKHVVEDLVDDVGSSLGTAYVCHLAAGDAIHFRRLRRVHMLRSADVAVAQADNYVEKYPNNPLMNLRARLSNDLPSEGAPIVTYGISRWILFWSRPAVGRPRSCRAAGRRDPSRFGNWLVSATSLSCRSRDEKRHTGDVRVRQRCRRRGPVGSGRP
jgi:hypothetical protein